MSETRRLLERAVGAYAPEPPGEGIDELLGRVRRRQRRGRLSAAILAVVVSVAGLAGLVMVFRPRPNVMPSGPLAQPQVMMSVNMVTATNGWGLRTSPRTEVAEHLMRTTDGGLHWQDVTPDTHWIADAQFIGSSEGWIGTLDGIAPGKVTPGPVRVRVFHTTDGGRSWTSSIMPYTCTQSCFGVSVSFADHAHGWVAVNDGVAGTSELFTTIDGGARWRLDGTTPFDGSIRFTTTAEGWGLGSATPAHARFPTLYRTTDGGRTWSTVVLSRPAGVDRHSAVISVTLPSFTGRRGVLEATFSNSHRSGTTAAVFFTSRDGGATWSATTPIRNRNLISYWSLPIALQGWGTWVFPSGDGRLYTSRDTGVTWTAIRPTPPDVLYLQQGSLDFVSPAVGYAVVPHGDCIGPIFGFCAASSTIYRTSDGGHTWTTDLRP